MPADITNFSVDLKCIGEKIKDMRFSNQIICHESIEQIHLIKEKMNIYKYQQNQDL